MLPSPSAPRLRGAFFCSGREPAPFLKRVRGEDLKNNGKGAVHVDRKTYEEAVALHSDTVTRLLLLRCRQPADAEDCYQEVFLKLLLRAECRGGVNLELKMLQDFFGFVEG